ncbi:LysR family transcriptional regulator [Wenxinia marina]|uniref:Transcriptional regulator n=1 Tax=Wenxinia marina DSM 24838 TaxID=1123501 RepID=A0A0D0NKK1_9RHOB|nr:LysR family transcriptional regulator [Wenxinia marina]KIQ68850.1 Transcriptional regulator [Wenxinia marina DSM 24838]GGL64729.1 LysR family transcriptional regulator [Wenxinia marina]
MIDKLEMFVALAQARHFGRAAEAVGVTQPTLSAAIKSLEAELGVMLVQRGSRFGGLTPEGKRVLDWARRIVGDARTMKEELRAARSGLSGDLRLAVIPTALSAVSELTTALAAAHPNVRFTILSATSTDILSMIEDLRVDAGITYLDNEPLGRVVTVPLYDERYALIVRNDSIFAGRASVPWAELGTLPLALLTPDMQNRRITGGHLAAAGVRTQPSVETNSTIVLISHVLQGWATVLPMRAAEIFLASAPVAAIPLVEPDARNAVGLVAPWREPHTPVIDALLREAGRLSGI